MGRVIRKTVPSKLLGEDVLPQTCGGRVGRGCTNKAQLLSVTGYHFGCRKQPDHYETHFHWMSCTQPQDLSMYEGGLQERWGQTFTRPVMTGQGTTVLN